MNPYLLSNDELAAQMAAALKAWRLSPNGVGLSQVAMAKLSGIGLTPLKRFEKTGAITLRNLIALLRASGLLDNLLTLVPDPDAPSPLDILAAEEKKAKNKRQRAPRRAKENHG